ncbi:MAG: copper(I)-binding protein [Candidatus Azotimanducaceae bacterium]|jgi:copper(I)-binding protein
MKRFSLGILLLLQASAVLADLEVTDGWARATPPGMPMGAIYATLINTSEVDVEVTGLSTPVARMSEIHESLEIDGLMRMREITPFIVRAGESVNLQPGGKHVMLMGLKDALEVGQTFLLDIELSDGKVIIATIVTGGYGQMSMPGS